MREPVLSRATARALADGLRAHRRVANLTQEKAAERAGVTRQHYQLLESGLSDRAKNTPANPRLSTLLALCQAFETTLPELLGDALQGTVEVSRPRHNELRKTKTPTRA